VTVVTLLCLDVRNSHTDVALFEGDEVQHVWRLSTVPHRTADEWGVLLSGLLTGVERTTSLAGVCVSSTVPAVLHELRSSTARHFAGAEVVILGPGVRTGLPVLMDNPREVGTDRVANAVAAAELIGGPCIVVDLGFATTFDVLNADGAYVGGVIAPGVEMSLAALGRGGAQLRQVELERPRSVIARNTIEALQSGAVFGFAGQVDGIVTRIMAELGLSGDAVEVVATGLVDSAVADECTTLTRREPHLTLHGLRFVHDRNR
jgi:type III pantothenate kinase